MTLNEIKQYADYIDQKITIKTENNEFIGIFLGGLCEYDTSSGEDEIVLETEESRKYIPISEIIKITV